MSIALVRPSTLCAWNGSSLLVVNAHGASTHEDDLTGYYFRETRFLRSLQFTVNGEAPWLCEAASLAPTALAFTYIYPELPRQRALPWRSLAIQLEYRVEPDGLFVGIDIANHAKRRVEFTLACALDADFADVLGIQARTDRQPKDMAAIDAETSATGVTFRYQHEQLRYRSMIEVTTHADWSITESEVAARVSLDAHDSIDLGFRVTASGADGSPLQDDMDDREDARRVWRNRFARLSIPANRTAERVVANSLRDFGSLPLLEGRPDEWLAPQAGIPLYPALFGRDALTAGWQAAWADCGQSLDASLTRLGRLQGRRVDDSHDEEPGRILQSFRQGPLALLNLNPYAAYYGDAAGPFMFVIALAHLYAWTGDLAIVRRHWDAARRVLDWARTHADRDGDGYIEYETHTDKGARNQGWKDSGDAIVYEDGSIVPTPLGTCELQGYWFAAQQFAAVISGALGRVGDARAFWKSAMTLKRRFNRDWWIDDDKCIALALDPDKRRVPAVSSNIGHCIAAGIVDEDHLPVAVDRLFKPDMFSGWGIRTLSSLHRAYDPLSYHCGSVWPVEQATIAFGLRRFGFDQRALQLCEAQFTLARLYVEHRIPECVGGYARGDRPTPAAFPQANPLQLWNVTAMSLLVHTMLGLQPVAPFHTLVVSPALPAWLPEVVVENLQLAESTAALRFWRDPSGQCHAEVLRHRGPFHLLEQPPPESMTAGIGDRLRALFDTVKPWNKQGSRLPQEP